MSERKKRVRLWEERGCPGTVLKFFFSLFSKLWSQNDLSFELEKFVPSGFFYLYINFVGHKKSNSKVGEVYVMREKFAGKSFARKKKKRSKIKESWQKVFYTEGEFSQKCFEGCVRGKKNIFQYALICRRKQAYSCASRNFYYRNEKTKKNKKIAEKLVLRVMFGIKVSPFFFLKKHLFDQ